MAKANKKSHSVFPKAPSMEQSFETMLKVLHDMSDNSRPIMPLFSDSIDLSVKIVKMYEKAFYAGKKFTPKK